MPEAGRHRIAAGARSLGRRRQQGVEPFDLSRQFGREPERIQRQEVAEQADVHGRRQLVAYPEMQVRRSPPATVLAMAFGP